VGSPTIITPSTRLAKPDSNSTLYRASHRIRPDLSHVMSAVSTTGNPRNLATGSSYSIRADLLGPSLLMPSRPRSSRPIRPECEAEPAKPRFRPHLIKAIRFVSSLRRDTATYPDLLRPAAESLDSPQFGPYPRSHFIFRSSRSSFGEILDILYSRLEDFEKNRSRIEILYNTEFRVSIVLE
jgi:hypothetical protein